MRNLLLTLTCLFLLGSTGFAQIGLTGYGGFTFADQFSGSDFSGKVEDAGHWGVGLEYMVHEFYGLELLYKRLDPVVSLRIRGQEFREVDVAMNYIMLSGNRYVPVSGAVKPYGGLGLGPVILTNKTDDETITKFAWLVKLGALFMPSDRIGLKVQAEFYSIVQGVGGSFYFGTGGSGAGISTYSSVYQFGFSGGITIRFGGETEGVRR